MVDLPGIQRRLVTTEEPRSRVSASDIAGPYRMMADALGSFSEGFNVLEAKAGEEAGLKAVATGADGMPTVELMPPVAGPYGGAYNRAARWKYMAELTPKIETEVQKAQLENAGNPEAFKKWSESFVRGVGSKERDPNIRATIEKVALNASEQAYRGLAADHFKRTVAGSKVALEARRSTLENTLAALARSGATGSKEYAEAMDDYDTIGREFAKNPLFAETEAEVAAKRDRMLSAHGALATVGRVRRVAEDTRVDEGGNPIGGAKVAKGIADELLTDTSLNLTPDERRSYHAQALAEIRQLNSGNRALISQLSTEATEWVRAIEGGAVDTEAVRDFLDRAADAGAAKATARVLQAASRQAYLTGWFDKLPAGDRARAVIELSGRGGSDNEVSRIIGIEGTGQAPTSSAVGIGQFTEGTWLDMIKRHAPEVAAGRSDKEVLALRTDPRFSDLAINMVGKFRDENRTALKAAGVRDDSPAVYLAHFLGAGDAVKVLKAGGDAPLVGLVQQRSIEANQGIFTRNPTAKDLIAWAEGKMTGAKIPAAVRGDPGFLTAVRKRAGEDLTRTLPKIEARVKAGETVDARELDDLGALTYAVGSDEQKRRVVEMAVLASVGDRLAGMSAQQREAAQTEFAQRFANGSTQLESEIGTYVENFSQKIAKAYKDDPYDAAVRYGGRTATPPVDFNDPASLDGAIKAREVERRFIREHEGSDPGTLLRPAEANALRGALLSSDPNKVARSAGIASNLLGSNADAFAGISGAENIQKEALKFRHYVDDLAMPAADAANRLIMERTPEHRAKIAARVKNEDVDKIVKDKVSVADLSSAFDPGLLSRAPAIGFTPEGRASMHSDYVELFREHYGETGDADTAKKLAIDQLKRVWGATSVSGNATVMRYPPEQAPAMRGIENAAGAIAEQAIADIRSLTGETIERGSLRILPVPGATASAFKSGQSVPYHLGWVDANGLPHWLPPGKAFQVDAEAMRANQTARRETSFREEQRRSQLAPHERLREALGLPNIFGEPREPVPFDSHFGQSGAVEAVANMGVRFNENADNYRSSENVEDRRNEPREPETVTEIRSFLLGISHTALDIPNMISAFIWKDPAIEKAVEHIRRGDLEAKAVAEGREKVQWFAEIEAQARGENGPPVPDKFRREYEKLRRSQIRSR
jgi:hypothetical protein